MKLSTFTLVARDPETGNFIVAGGTNWFCYGRWVPHIEGGFGALATQAETNMWYAPNGIEDLKKGMSAEETLSDLPLQEVFEKISTTSKHLEYVPKATKKDVILVGYNRTGYSIVNTLKKMKKSFLVVDYNPEGIKDLIEKKVPCIYGDIGDSEIMERINLKKAKLVVSTIDNLQDNKLLIKQVKKANKKLIVFVVAAHVEDALELYDFGADYVVLPHLLGGDKVSFMVEHHAGKVAKLLKEKLKHIKELKSRHS